MAKDEGNAKKKKKKKKDAGELRAMDEVGRGTGGGWAGGGGAGGAGETLTGQDGKERERNLEDTCLVACPICNNYRRFGMNI